MIYRLSLIFSLLLAATGLAACDASGYRKSGDQWTHGKSAFAPLDSASFKALDDLFARDNIRGYYRGTPIEGSDGATFVVVSENEARDKAHVYWCDTFRKGQEYWSIPHLRIGRIEGADAATYVSIGKGYARDARRVYAQGVPFAVRDPATFVPLEGAFGRDSQRGYYARVEIAGSDGPSFETIDERDTSYARDRVAGYYGYRDIDSPREPNVPPRTVVQKLRKATPASIRVLGRDYAADDSHVWHRGLLVDGADASTFAVDTTYLGEADASDKSGAWLFGKHVTTTTKIASASGVSTK